MSRNFLKTLILLFALTPLVQGQTPVPPPKVQPRIAAPIPTPAPALTDAMSANPNVHVAEWVVSVIHKVEVNKLLERMRKETRAQVGVPGSMPEFVYNVTTGVVIDDHGHIITRLANLDPEDKEQNISIVTNSGQSLPAKFIGLDCPSGFAVLEVAALKVAAPETAPPVTQGKLVRILSADVEQKVAANNYPKRFDILPSIKAMSGQIETESPYAQARGALTLRSANLRSRNDSAIVTTLENQLVGVAQYVGFGRAYLFPIDLLRNTIAKRVLEKQATVLTGWLGVTGENLFQMSPQEFQALGIERRIGVVVKEVSPNSPAAQSGLKAKDVIIGFDNFEVASTNDLSTFLSSSPSGKTITLRTIRDQQPVEIHVVLGVKASSQPLIAVQQFEAQPQTIAGQIDETRRRIEELQGQYRFYQKMPKTDEREESLKELTIELRELFEAMRVLEAAQAEENSKYPEANSYSTQPVKKSCTLKTGFTAWEMPKQLADSFGTPKSVLVDSVRKGSAAEVAGLKAGDVLVSATGEALTCAQTEALFANPFATLTLRVLRKKQPLSLLIKP